MENVKRRIQKLNLDFFPIPEGFTNNWNYQ